MVHLQGCGPDIMVNFPKEERIRFVIDTLVRFIMEDGTDLEQLLLEAEHSNPEFDFLRDVDSPEHMYYRWKLYSLCNDDSMSAWRTEPFVMIEGSNRIHPPPLVSPAFQSETAAQRGGDLIYALPAWDLHVCLLLTSCPCLERAHQVCNIVLFSPSSHRHQCHGCAHPECDHTEPMYFC